MNNLENKKVDFFIVGAPKAGTTALHAHLDKHPQVCMSSDKEPNFFSWAEIDKQQLYYNKVNVKTASEYQALFNCNETVNIKGEASVSYLFYDEVPKRIKAYNPNAKIIISLRKPTLRAFSHYQMDYSLGLVTDSFEKIFTNGKDHPKTGNFFQQYFLLSEYAPQVKRYADVFDLNNICILLHEELIQQPEQTLERVFSFLSIDASTSYELLEKQNVTGAGKNRFIRSLYKNQSIRKVLATLLHEDIRNKIKSNLFSKNSLPVLSKSFEQKLNDYYRPGIEQLISFTGLSIAHWIQESIKK
jgi:Sulfotransferase domain